MPGMGDSRNPDDLKLHIETIQSADDAQKVAPEEGESEDERVQRTSVLLPAPLRAELDAVYTELATQVPGLSAAETAKLLATRTGRDALTAGQRALARVDTHLQSVTGERNPPEGKTYGVYGENPESFAGVMRALELSSTENARLAALPADAAERKLLFTELVAREVNGAHDGLARLLGTRVDTRADLSRRVEVKDETRERARRVIARVRNHLYANLPKQKKDPDLRQYGFRPVVTSRRRRTTDPSPPPVPQQ